MKILIFFFFVLFVGCGKKEVVTEVVEPVAEAKPIEPVAEVKPVEEKQPEVKKEIKPIEPVTDAKAEPGGINIKESKVSEGIRYLKDSDTPYTGKVFRLYKNGQKEYEGNYKDGKRDGLLVAWYPDGKKLSEGNWKDGKPDGLWMGWHVNGQKRDETNYKDGKRDGLQVAWHENGQKMIEGNYKDGKLVEGSEKHWNSKGGKLIPNNP